MQNERDQHVKKIIWSLMKQILVILMNFKDKEKIIQVSMHRKNVILKENETDRIFFFSNIRYQKARMQSLWCLNESQASIHLYVQNKLCPYMQEFRKYNNQ